jgi:phage terminase large subunit
MVRVKILNEKVEEEFGIKVEDSYMPTPKQLLAHNSKKRYILYGGAMGGGKTRWICEHIKFHMIQFPGNRGYIGRKVYSDFKLSTYLQLQKALEPYMQAGLIKENKEDKVFHFWNKSDLFYGQFDDDSESGTNRLFSSEFGVIACDEAWELSEDQFKKAGTRLRHKCSQGVNPLYQFVMASNPAQNWLKDRFILKPNPLTEDFIQSLPKENPYNPEDYEAQIRDLFRGDEKFIQAFLEGNWDAIGSFDDLFTMEMLKPQLRKEIKVLDTGGLVYDIRLISCDPARFGDDKTVIYCAQNERIVYSQSYGKKDLMETVGNILHWDRIMGGAVIVTDDTGLGGGITDRLIEEGNMDKLLPINFGSKASDSSKFTNKRAEMYWNAMLKIREGIWTLPEEDKELIGDLLSIKYKFKSDGKIYLESKEEIKKRRGKSPDRADAYVMLVEAWMWCLTKSGKEQYVNKLLPREPEWVRLRRENSQFSSFGDENFVKNGLYF